MTLRLLCDEHVGGELYRRLEAQITDVIHISNIDELGEGCSDADIWEYATNENYNIFTNDTHFIDGTANPDDVTHPGVIRYVGIDWPKIAQAVGVIEQHLTTKEIAKLEKEIHVPGDWL